MRRYGGGAEWLYVDAHLRGWEVLQKSSSMGAVGFGMRIYAFVDDTQCYYWDNYFDKLLQIKTLQASMVRRRYAR